jgi:hypothetical protein
MSLHLKACRSWWHVLCVTVSVKLLCDVRLLIKCYTYVAKGFKFLFFQVISNQHDQIQFPLDGGK